MSNSSMLISFSLFFFFISFASSSSFNATHKCSPQQALDLLLFKEKLISINDTHYASYCEDRLGSDYYPIMMNWNKNTDCCKWDGVTCRHFTGDVIGIDLTCGMLRGIIHPNTTLFHLPHLQTLNLALNDFTASHPLHFTDTLTHLNISDCKFAGKVPTEISFLPNLVSLDLSGNYEMQIQPYVLKNLLQNSTHLRELLISHVQTGWVLPTYLNISSSLKTLALASTGLQGKFPDNMFNLRYLEKLDLSGNNDITGPLPKVNTSSNIPLKWLDLSFTGLQGKLPDNIFNLRYLEKLDLSDNYDLSGPLPKVNTSSNIPLKWLGLSSINLSGEIPDSIAHLKSLNYLGLSSCGLVGPLPKSMINLRHLSTLDLSNNKLNGTLPSFLFTLPFLENLYLHWNMLSGGLPSEIFNCRSLKVLSLHRNQLDGEINGGSSPPSIIQLANLTDLDLSSNNFTGLWDLNTLLASLPNLQFLYLSYSGLTVVSNNGTGYVNPEFLHVELASCKLNVFPESLRAMKNLIYLDLSSNNIQGRIPDWAGEIGGNWLYYLNLSCNYITGLPQFQWDGVVVMELQSNQIQGPFPPSICSMRNLESLDVSDNSFGGVIPQCLGNMTSLSSLNAKSNQIHGPVPSSICNMSTLEYLDMSNNSFGGVIPQCLGSISSSLRFLNVKSNQIHGSLPSSICNMKQLFYLDLSDNSFDGVLPQCPVNISSSLRMVDMGNNHFHGTMPNVFGDCGQLEGLILNGNQLQGEVPSSLSRCKYLKVLDLGNNQLNGTFPDWLSDLPDLQVLVLKSNKLHGPIETPSTDQSAFPSMQVLDLSHNRLVGHLPGKYFQTFNAMKNVTKNNEQPEYLYVVNKYYSMIIAVKGVEQEFLRLFVDYTILHLSNNRFEGEIPGIIGSLTSLKVLNLSHNSLTGNIPYDLGNLSEIESLDLSWNQLTGEIPQSLADITGLEVLNLSQNNLVGRIPHGTQFDTFNASFEGNPKLCGFPLPRKCEHPRETQLEVDGDEDDESGFTWRVVMMGFGCGTILGLVMGYVMLSTGRPKWFNAIADAAEHMVRTRKYTRRYVFIGK